LAINTAARPCTADYYYSALRVRGCLSLAERFWGGPRRAPAARSTSTPRRCAQLSLALALALSLTLALARSLHMGDCGGHLLPVWAGCDGLYMYAIASMRRAIAAASTQPPCARCRRWATRSPLGAGRWALGAGHWALGAGRRRRRALPRRPSPRWSTAVSLLLTWTCVACQR
jgi:hypothetical protein